MSSESGSRNCRCGGTGSCDSTGTCGGTCSCGGTGSCSGEATDDRDATRAESPIENKGSPLPLDYDHDKEHAEVPEMPDLGNDWRLSDLDEHWERRAAGHLADVDFDTELGVEIARDSLRVAQGDLTKAEFHEKHHDAVAAEFGIDDRPTRDAYNEEVEHSDRSGETDRNFPRVPDAEPLPSRRGLLKGAGAALAAGATAGLAGCVSSSTSTSGTAAAQTGVVEEGDVQMGMVIDTDRCIACMLCAEACKRENDTDVGTHWMHVFRYEEDEYGDAEEGYMPRPCQHCSDPTCAYVCPTQARHKRGSDGLVLTDYDTCIGCKYCQIACPYGVNFLGKDDSTDVSPGFFGSETSEGRTTGGPPPKGVMGKCTFCVHRQDDSSTRGTTACEDDCPVDAIHFGDMKDPGSQPRQYLREQRGTSRFKLLEQQGTEPNVVYLGHQPSQEATPTDGPYTYEDLGMEKLGEHRGDDE